MRGEPIAILQGKNDSSGNYMIQSRKKFSWILQLNKKKFLPLRRLFLSLNTLQLRNLAAQFSKQVPADLYFILIYKTYNFQRIDAFPVCTAQGYPQERTKLILDQIILNYTQHADQSIFLLIIRIILFTCCIAILSFFLCCSSIPQLLVLVFDINSPQFFQRRPIFFIFILISQGHFTFLPRRFLDSLRSFGFPLAYFNKLFLRACLFFGLFPIINNKIRYGILFSIPLLSRKLFFPLNFLLKSSLLQIPEILPLSSPFFNQILPLKTQKQGVDARKQIVFSLEVMSEGNRLIAHIVKIGKPTGELISELRVLSYR